MTAIFVCDGALTEPLGVGHYEWGIVLHTHDDGRHKCLFLTDEDLDVEDYPDTIVIAA